MNAASKTLPKRSREERAVVVDPSLKLLDYADIANLMSLSNYEAARKLVESVPELARLKLKVGRRARIRETDFRAWLDSLSGRSGHAE